MDTEQLASFVSASADVGNPSTLPQADLSVILQSAQLDLAYSRPQSSASTATERPTLHLDDTSSYPRKPPSVDSNFSSVQGKTAGTPPEHDQADEADETVSSIWDESRTGKTQPLHAPSEPPATEQAQSIVLAPSSSAPPPASSRPDWMTDDLDESWPEEDQAAQSTPTPNNAASASSAVSAAQANALQSQRSSSPARSSEIAGPLATPSVASRPPRVTALSNGLPDPAFSAARHQARRALLKGRASAAGAPTPRGATSTSALQAGPATPSMRLPSHQGRRDRLRRVNAENEEGDSTIWSESESESDSASNGSAPDDFASARGSLAENSRITNMQTAQQSSVESQKQTQSPSAATDASGAKGTFIHKADVSSLPPILRPVWQSPAKGQQGQKKGMAALGGDMFTPMKLQTMFKTPTPPEKPVRSIMSALAAASAPFPVSEAPQSVAQAAAEEVQEGLVEQAPASNDEGKASLGGAAESSSNEVPTKAGPGLHIGIPSTPFTFQSPHASLHVSRGIVPSQSLQNMQSLHPNPLHATALARPASAAADLNLHSPAVARSALSGPPTPHTPMRLFKFNYDNADARAKLEMMVNEKTPAQAQQPTRAGDLERERKRLRLDVKPRKVMTGDLMSMPVLNESAPTQTEAPQTADSGRQPVIDYVKESTGFMSALQDAVRVHSPEGATSPEWATEEENSAGSAGRQREHISFHQGKAEVPMVSSSSPVRSRRSPGKSTRERSSPRGDAAPTDVVPSVREQGSPQRIISRKLPLDSSFITESSSTDIPMSSTLKSRASLSRRIASQVRAASGESPRKLLRRISASAIAEAEVEQEFDGEEAPVKLAEDAIAYRDQQIRQLEERIARRRKLYNSSKPADESDQAGQPALQGPQLITLHEPTLEAIAGGRQRSESDDSDEESEVDDSMDAYGFDAQGQQDGQTRRFQDGIVLYDSERVPDPPLPDPSRALRNIASAVELRNRGTDRVSLARATSLLALPTQPHPAGAVAEGTEAPAKRGDRTASSNTLVDPSNARTVSGDVGSQLSDLGGKGATITRTGSLFNISQIPEEEIQNLGGGKQRFNKELNRWEKVARSRSSQDDLRSVAASRNDMLDMPMSRTPVPPIPEASVELTRSEDVFSESAEEQQARAHPGARRSNSFQQRLGNLSANNLSAVDGRLSDSSDPFRDFESFGQSSHAVESPSNAADVEDESTPKPVKSQMFVSRQQYGVPAPKPTSATSNAVPSHHIQIEPSPAAPIRPSPPFSSAQVKVTPPKVLAPRTLPTSTVPRSSSSLRNVVTYSPDSTASSRHSSLGHHAADGRDSPELPVNDGLKRDAQGVNAKPAPEPVNVFATPDRRLAHHQLGTPTPKASASSISTPKSILKQGSARLNGPSHSTSVNSGGGGGTPNRTISFADPPSTARARDLGLAPLSRGQRARANLQVENDDGGDGRTQAISSALQMLADLTIGDTSAVLGSEAIPSTRMRDLDANRSHWSNRTLARPRKTRHEIGDEAEHSWQGEDETYDELHGYPDMTLMTDASFNFAHDKVLEAITDVEPWEPGWDELQAVNLSRRRLESCVRLKEFLPMLEEVDLQTNELSYLTGIPASVRVLNVAQNRLTSMASFGHLLHLEELDISGNQIDSLTHLSCLKHLHTLKADGNAISSLDGIDKIRSLVHVSLSGNRLKGVNLATTQWAGLETFDASHNQLISIRGLSAMRRLKSLNLDHNQLSMIDLSPSMPKLRVLRVSGNVQLQTLDVAPAKRLRTLYADYCDLDRIDNLDQLEHLDNLSMRQQAEASIAWPAAQLRDVRRLFLSGNAFPQGISTPPALPAAIAAQPVRFLNLVYLELSACQLTHLPEDLADLAPNLRSLNLDHNLISTLPSLAGMQRLKRLSLVGCRVKKSKSIISAVRGLPELMVIDSRTNPCTLGLYAPLIAPAAVPTRPDDGEIDALAASWLPPVPNAQVVQPDLLARQQRARRLELLEVGEKSHFHKRKPPLADYAIDPNTTIAVDARREAEKEEASYSALFEAADRRFKKTLPKQFGERRVLHRGLLAMACPKLSWVDGLMVEESEVEEADRLVQSHRFDRV